MRSWIAVALGGIIGTGLRLASDTAFPHTANAFPWDTLIINLVGSLVLGVLAGGVWGRPGLPPWLKVGLGSGVIGSFTTFSALTAASVTLTTAGAGWLALTYVGVSLLLGLGAAALGLRVGASAAHRRMPREITDEGIDL
ncbi:MAG TPA: CrcB family protein [Candidatus Lumbricidophila sp.]|nr:CrcB family protein [Candidatus Lumbricidophila sp.]